jgi:phage/plasmid-associated DNA primase
MRQDFFTYDPQFTLIIAGNNKPSLRGVGEAIRRRFHLIPFNVIIPPAERDKALAEKLKAEWPGILRWAIDGCLMWQREGLKPPAGVVAATKDYLAGEDIIGQWIGDCCEEGHALRHEQDLLYASWSEWSERNRGPRHSSRAFYRLLTERGFEQKKMDGKRWMLGLALRPTGAPTGTEGTKPPLSTVYAHARAHTHSTSDKEGSVPSVPTAGARVDPNACIHCGEHCAPSDTANSIRRSDSRWYHLECELAQP